LSDSNSDGILDTVASPSRTQAWDLDAMGNWQSLSTNGTGQSRTHNAQNQVTGVGSASLTFDANGSMTTDETGNTFTYDAWNRLVEAVDGSSVTQAEYAYDALGRRIVETRPVASTTDHLYHSTGWQVLEERRGGTASGDVRHQYLWSIDYVDAMVARVDYASGTVTAKYNVAYDANWNVTAIFDHNNLGAAIRERYAYDPYGAVTILAPNGTVRSSSSYDWKYLHQTGRLDGDTGLYHFRNRDYSPTLGRWTQTDPIGFEAGDTNLYRYVGSGPVNGVDPSGLAEGPEDTAIKRLPGQGTTAGDTRRIDVGWGGRVGTINTGSAVCKAVDTALIIPERIGEVALDAATDRLSGGIIDWFGRGFRRIGRGLGVIDGDGPPPGGFPGRPKTPRWFPVDITKLPKDIKKIGDRLKRLKGIPWGQYAEYGCDEVADKIEKSIGGNRFRIKPVNPDGWLPGRRDRPFTNWGYHEVIVKDGRVYDAWGGPYGVPISDYKAEWTDPGAINWKF
jgi:RHS repeat-associated protein